MFQVHHEQDWNLLSLLTGLVSELQSYLFVKRGRCESGEVDLIFLFINHLVIGPIQCCFTIYFLWSDYGYSCLGGIGVVSGLAVLQSFQSRIFYKLRMMIAKRSDLRIKIVDEMINAMKAIKGKSY